MTIPCPGCQMQHSCARDKHCNRPSGLGAAAKEMSDACDAWQAAAARLQQALAGVNAALLIYKSQQP